MCDQMGFYAFSSYDSQKPRKASRRMFLLTGGEEPFCEYHQRVTIVLSDTRNSIDQGGDRGVFYMILNGNEGSSEKIKLSAESFFQPGRIYTFMTTTSHLGKVSSADLIWEYSSHPANPLTWRFLSPSKMFVNRIEIEEFDTRTKHTFCAEDRPFVSGVPQRVIWRPNCRKNGKDFGPGLIGTVLNVDPIGGTLAVLDFVNPLQGNPLNGLEAIENTFKDLRGGIKKATDIVRRMGNIK